MLRTLARVVLGLLIAFFGLLEIVVLYGAIDQGVFGPLVLVTPFFGAAVYGFVRLRPTGSSTTPVTLAEPPRVSGVVPTQAPQPAPAPPSLPWTMAVRIAAIDVETTGLDPTRHRVIEVGVVVTEGGQVIGRRSWLVNPGRKIPKTASKLNGILDEDVAVAPPFAEIAAELVAMLDGAVVLAYHAPFDRAFIASEFRRAGLSWPAGLSADWIDPCVWARELQPAGWSAKLTDVAARLGIPVRNAHRAAADAELALAVFFAQSRDRRFPRSLGELLEKQARAA